MWNRSGGSGHNLVSRLLMRRFFQGFTAASTIAIVLASVGETVGQFSYNGYYGTVGGAKTLNVRTQPFDIARSPWGATAGRLSYGNRRLLATPFVLYDSFSGRAPHASHYGLPGADDSYRFAPPSPRLSGSALKFDRGVSSRYTSPQDRYTMLISPYGTASGTALSSRYSLGAPSAADRRWNPPDPTRPLPFARSPYDADAAEGFGVTGTAPARSLSDRELADGLVRAASELDDALAAQQDGDVWQDYLQPQTIAELFRSRNARAADAQSLHELQINFEATVGNPELRWVTKIAGFTATRQLLNEWFQRRSASDESGMEIQMGPEIETGPDIQPDHENIEVEELPAPVAEPRQDDFPQLNPPQVEAPQDDPSRRYEL